MSNADRDSLARVWTAPRGWRYWSAVNNNEVGVWYLITAFGFFLFAGVLALLMRLQLAVPDNDFVSAGLYDQLFTLHGSVMMFLFAVPVFEAFSILLLPAMLGTRDLPFPRLTAYGYWSFALGGVFVCGSIFFGAAPSGGWFMYPPLTTRYTEGVGPDIWLLGLSFIEIAAIAAAVELIVGILKCRAPGMRIEQMPLYAWYLLVVALMILFAFPPLIAGDLLFELERAFDWPFFDAARGGDPLLWQHLFWIFGHPEVYIIFLPAAGVVAMIVPTFARRPVVGYAWIVLAAMAVGFLGFGLWVHHMFTTGLPQLSLAFFSAASEAVAIPTAVQIFCFIATIAVGRFTASVPMLFVAGALAIFVLGGLTGVMVALAPFDFQAHDTYFVVAHLHYVLIGGMLFPVFAGVHYYYPLVAGKSLSPRLGKLAFWLMFVGFNVAFLPMHFSGLRGMPRRVYTYAEGLGFDSLNLLSTIGAFVLAAGIAVLVADVLRPKRGQPPAPRNPWRAGTLEWLMEIPTASWMPRSIPLVRTRYPLWQQPGLVAEVEAGGGYLPHAHEGYRETLITSAVAAEPQQCLRTGGPSFLPMLAALFTGSVFIAATYHAWHLSLAGGVLALAAILRWLWTGTSRSYPQTHKDVGRGLSLPLQASGPRAPGWWAMLITLAADSTAFLSLLFGYFFFWTVHPDFPPAAAGAATAPGFTLAIVALLAAWALMLLARHGNRHDRGDLTGAALLGAAALNVAGTALLIAAPLRAGLDPTAHVYPAVVWVLVLWIAAHTALGLVMQLYCFARRAAGRLSAAHDADLVNVCLYWHFMAATVALAGAVLVLFPQAA